MDWFEITLWVITGLTLLWLFTWAVYEAGFQAGTNQALKQHPELMDLPVFKQVYGKGPLG